MPNLEELAKHIINAGVFGLATPPYWIKFKSLGMHSPVYLNNRALLGNPEAWDAIIKDLVRRADTMVGLGPDVVIAGVDGGGTTHAARVAGAMSLPCAVILKEEKTHGLAQRIYGAPVKGKSVLLIEDHCTTAASTLRAADAIVASGGVVKWVLSITNYTFANDPEAITRAFVDRQIRYECVVPFWKLFGYLQWHTLLSDDENRRVWEWLQHPQLWTERHVPLD